MTHLSIPIPDGVPPALWKRFASKFRVSESGCWEWTSADNGSGYGMFWLDGKTVYSHRVSYSWFVGPIPSDLELDHLCRVRNCCNPDHLEAVTASINTRRRPDRAVTHCPQGHPYAGANLYARGGRRHCRACNRARVAEFHARNPRRAPAVTPPPQAKAHPTTEALPMADGCPDCLIRDVIPSQVEHLPTGYYASYRCTQCGATWWTGWSTESGEVPG